MDWEEGCLEQDEETGCTGVGWAKTGWTKPSNPVKWRVPHGVSWLVTSCWNILENCHSAIISHPRGCSGVVTVVFFTCVSICGFVITLHVSPVARLKSQHGVCNDTTSVIAGHTLPRPQPGYGGYYVMWRLEFTQWGVLLSWVTTSERMKTVASSGRRICAHVPGYCCSQHTHHVHGVDIALLAIISFSCASVYVNTTLRQPGERSETQTPQIEKKNLIHRWRFIHT